jgi:CO/xanthine dehydrogenase Mo-binding subunit
LYNKAPNVHFFGKAVYTNLPVAGAYRGYGATQGYFPLETAMDELAERLNIDPIELRRRNHIRSGETSPIFEKLGEGREGVAFTIKSCELPRCIEIGAERIGWTEKRGKRTRNGSWVHGIGMSIHMQGSGIPQIDMGAATIKMNEDGSFNLLIGYDTRPDRRRSPWNTARKGDCHLLGYGYHPVRRRRLRLLHHLRLRDRGRTGGREGA